MDKDSLKSTLEEVRKSVVRISFDWKREENMENMVIAGLVTSVVDELATIIANPVFFRRSNEFSVRLPQNGGYGELIKISCSLVKYPTNNFFTFLLELKGNAYRKPVNFELGIQEDVRQFMPSFSLGKNMSHQLAFVKAT
ncbi:hypothetical protein CFC21_048203 [Triticum aestivum]|uniref:Uncharacterized protein n=5 Tax=Triticinae TaxID=1648030 RepID=A0A453FL76_AEGTS|nr:hypothetical protein CFC21_048203 [Triticum aestivum]